MSKTTRDLLIDLYNSAEQLREALAYTQEENYYPDVELGFNDPFFLHVFASRVRDQTEDWLEAMR